VHHDVVPPTGQSGVQRTVRCATDSPVHGLANSLLSRFLAYVGYDSPDNPRVAPDSPVSQQPTTSGHIGPQPTVKWRTGQSGVPHQTVRCPQNRKAANQGFSARARPAHCSLSSVHWTVQCTRRQKATRAFQMELQLLLGPLGL
jgi:hypothetical protein